VNTPQTWHYGLVSEWWTHFNVDGPEIEYYGRFVAAGQPALDAGCGTGRLLVPWLRAGYDVDGADVSGDMLARCRERARAEGFEPLLLEQPLHKLEPPRRYRTIVVCGVFGLGSTREQDEEALRRLHAVLEPGGVLLLDHEVPYASKGLWELWTSEGRGTLPRSFPENGERKSTAAGTEYELRSRVLALDPLDESVVMELRVDKRRDGLPVASDVHGLSMRMYFGEELRLLLGRAGFGHVEVRGGFSERPPTPDDRTLVFRATS
jgi:SAM-dependent methyltransferase